LLAVGTDVQVNGIVVGVIVPHVMVGAAFGTLQVVIAVAVELAPAPQKL
jgi:hypothetical protein